MQKHAKCKIIESLVKKFDIFAMDSASNALLSEIVYLYVFAISILSTFLSILSNFLCI